MSSGEPMMKIEFEPIGVVRTGAGTLPRNWTVSDVEGTIVLDEAYREGLKDVKAGQRIVVLFHLHESPQFTPRFLVQTPPQRSEPMGVFSICSSVRPNPIGMSVLEVLGVEGSTVRVRGLDMRDGTPVLDIKPVINK